MTHFLRTMKRTVISKWLQIVLLNPFVPQYFKEVCGMILP